MSRPPAYSLAQCIERLPAHARDRLENLRAEVTDANALVATLMARYTATREEYDRVQRRYGRAVKTGDSDEAKKLQADLEAVAAKAEKLDRERSKRNSAAASTLQMITRIESFVEALHMGYPNNIVPPPRISLTPQLQEGETLIAAIERLRTAIGRVRSELAYVSGAPLPADEIRLGVLHAVNEMAEQGQPRLSIEGTKVKLDWPDQMQFTTPDMGALSAPSGSASKLLCWALRDHILRQLLARVTDLEGAIPAAERPGRIQALEARLFELEVAEEHWVAQAIADGLEVHRRGDASPWAVLGYGLAPELPVVAEAAE